MLDMKSIKDKYEYNPNDIKGKKKLFGMAPKNMFKESKISLIILIAKSVLAIKYI